MTHNSRLLQGKVLSIEKTGEKCAKGDQEWEKCIFHLELTGFSKRTPGEKLPTETEGKTIKLVRWCRLDWHYKVGIIKTLEPDETETVLEGERTATAFW